MTAKTMMVTMALEAAEGRHSNCLQSQTKIKNAPKKGGRENHSSKTAKQRHRESCARRGAARHGERVLEHSDNADERPSAGKEGTSNAKSSEKNDDG